MKRSLAFVLVVAGCGSDISTAGVDSFIAALAQQSCAWLYKCCKDPEILNIEGRKFTDQARCEDYKELALINQLYLDRLAVQEGRLRLDNTRVAACLAQLAGKACNPGPGTNPAPNPMTMDACANVFIGATPIGRECIYANECVEGARCVQDPIAVGRGVCVPYQKPGEICNKTADCDPRIPNLYCALQDFTCRLRGQLGEPCAYTLNGTTSTLPMLLECDPTTDKLYCDPTSRTCKNLPQNGQPCLTPTPPGVTAVCDPDPTLDLRCDTSSTTAGICRAPGKLGDDCTRIECADDLYCDRVTTTTDTCRARPTLGQECDRFNKPCKEPFFCNTNVFPSVCAQPAKLNEDCSTISCDTGLYCDRTGATDLCRPQRPDGALCAANEECLSDDCGFANPRVCQPRTFGLQCTGR